MRRKRRIASPKVAIFLAFKSLLKGNRGITIMTIAMLSMIYVNLLFVPSVIQGITNKINLQLRETMTSDLVISSAESRVGVKQVDQKIADIKQQEGVESVTSSYRVGTQITKGNTSNNWSVEAIDPASFTKVFKTASNILEGQFLSGDDQQDYIFLGVGIAGADKKSQSEYAISLRDAHVGDTVSVKLIDGQEHDFIIKGIYDNNFMYSDRFAYISNNTAKRLLPFIDNSATAIYIKTDDQIDDNSIGQAIIKDDKTIKFQSADEMGVGIKEQIDAFDILYKIIEVFSLAVAAITVFIVTYVELINRRKQIGIERAIGIRPTAIVGVYVFKSIILTIIGTIIGCVLFNFVFAKFVEMHPFDFPFGPVVLNIDNSDMWRFAFIMIAVSIVSAIIPAIRSVKIKILDAIWG